MASGDKVEIRFAVTIPENITGETWWVNHAYLTYDNINDDAAFLNVQPDEVNNSLNPSEEFVIPGQKIGMIQNRPNHDPAALSDIPETATYYHSTVPDNNAIYKYTADIREYTNVTGPELEINKEQATFTPEGVQRDARTKEYIEVIPGDLVKYYITVTNTGDAPAKNISITDPVPKGLTLVSGSASNGLSIENEILTWNIDELGIGDSKTIEVSFSCQLPENVTEKVYFRNTAYADWDENPNDSPKASNEVIIGDPPDNNITTPTNNTDNTNSNKSNNSSKNTPTTTNPTSNTRTSTNNNMNTSTKTTNPATTSTSTSQAKSPTSSSKNNTNTSTSTSKLAFSNSTPTKSTLSANTTSSPKTGIESGTAIWIVVAVLAVIALIARYIMIKRKMRENTGEKEEDYWLDI